MRQAAGVFSDAAIVGQMRNRFYVRERPPAQRQPFGLEDARTGLAQCRGRNVLQHVGLLKCETYANKRGGRFPASPWSLLELAGSTGPGGLIVSTVYSGASTIGTTDTKVRPVALART